MPRKPKPQFDTTKVSLDHRNTMVPGVSCIELTHSNWPMPIGNLWYRQTGNSGYEILDVYVSTSARRRGIAKLLLAELRRSYPRMTSIVTAGVNRLSKPWLQHAGFQQFSNGDWLLILKNIHPKVKR